MGEINRAQELRVDEISFQKFRENHETIQQITSLLHQMQEQMNLMNDSDVKSNYGGRLSHGSNQPVMIRVLVLCSAATKDCRLTSGINLDYRKTFLEINFPRMSHPRDHPQRIQFGRRAQKPGSSP